MVLTFEQDKEMQELKQKNKLEIENLTHKNTMEQLEKQLEIAKVGVGNESSPVAKKE